jgi:sugar phosphate isomerase/epimerase
MSQATLADNLRQTSTAYNAVEMGIPATAAERDQLAALLEKNGLQLVAQQWTKGQTAADHQQSFEEQYLHAVDMGQVQFVNSHTGKDFFSIEENQSIFTHALALEEEHGLPVVHEIHRGRATFSTNSVNQLLDRLPSIRLCADFSHWCCVHESFLHDQSDSVERALAVAGHCMPALDIPKPHRCRIHGPLNRSMHCRRIWRGGTVT